MAELKSLMVFFLPSHPMTIGHSRVPVQRTDMIKAVWGCRDEFVDVLNRYDGANVTIGLYPTSVARSEKRKIYWTSPMERAEKHRFSARSEPSHQDRGDTVSEADHAGKRSK
jgi:hypothetical protein